MLSVMVKVLFLTQVGQLVLLAMNTLLMVFRKVHLLPSQPLRLLVVPYLMEMWLG